MATQTVVINAMKFNPPTIEIQAGDSVQWKNEMGFAHTSTSDDGTPNSWDTGHIAGNTTSKAVPFTAKGNNPYHCSIHPQMKGTVVVK
jgi:plastocyanin